MPPDERDRILFVGAMQDHRINRMGLYGLQRGGGFRAELHAGGGKFARQSADEKGAAVGVVIDDQKVLR